MSIPTFPCPSGETCSAPERCAHQECIHSTEAQSVPAPNLLGHTGFSLAADAFFKLFPREVRADGSDPRMVVLFDLIDKAASYWAMSNENAGAEPDEPVVQEVKRG